MQPNRNATLHSEIQNGIQLVTQHLPVLTKPQATVLALWSVGIALTRSCGLTTVATCLAELLDQEDTLRQRLREWFWNAEAKKGSKRRTLDYTACFPYLLRWILQGWASDRRLALAMDATVLQQTFGVLTISVLYRRCAIPVAWKGLPMTQRGEHKTHWLALFSALQGVIPADWTVVVFADRGLYASWLFRYLVQRGWHPVLRIPQQGCFRRQGASRWESLAQWRVPRGGWCGVRGVYSKTHPVECTLLVYWGSDYAEPWRLVTDLGVRQVRAQW